MTKKAIAETVLVLRKEAKALVSSSLKGIRNNQQLERQKQQQTPPPVSLPALSALSAPLSFPTTLK